MKRHSRTFLYTFCTILILTTIYMISIHRFTYQSNPNQYFEEQAPFFNSQKSKAATDLVRILTKCKDRSRRFAIHEHGDFLVYYNAIPANRDYQCHESVTLATQGDYTFLDNLERLVVRWKGPISVALYAPGDDFNATITSIAYLRQCQSELIKEYVTFHLFYDRKHYPKEHGSRIYDAISNYDEPIDCNSYQEPPYYKVQRADMYKTKNKLPYPINVARNIAIQSVQTHFVLATDMELIPSVGIIDNFLNMIFREYENWDASELLQIDISDKKEVYALALIEITADSKVPATKTQLQELYADKKAFFFAEKRCIDCQGIPDRIEWMNATETEDLNVFATAKRQGKYERWEPVYIGTRADPFFDERVTWEGTTNKMIQAFVLCLLDYDFLVLDNAFLVHKPGITKKSSQLDKDKHEMSQIISKTIVPELLSVYGKRKGCVVGGQFTRKTGA